LLALAPCEAKALAAQLAQKKDRTCNEAFSDPVCGTSERKTYGSICRAHLAGKWLVIWVCVRGGAGGSSSKAGLIVHNCTVAAALSQHALSDTLPSSMLHACKSAQVQLIHQAAVRSV
jgi:hypothetical protein